MTPTGRVVVTHRRFTALVRPSTPAVERLILRLVPADGREPGPEPRTWIVHGTRVAALLPELRARGVDVVERGTA